MDLQDPKQSDSSSSSTVKASDTSNSTPTKQETPLREIPSRLSTSISSWAQSLKGLQLSQLSHQDDSQSGNEGKLTLQRLTSGFGSLMTSNSSPKDASVEHNSKTTQSNVFGSLTKGLMDSSRTAMKNAQVKARQIASQNKKRYQEGEFDLDLAYITDKIIAMGFPSGYISSGFLGLFEGFYRNHMEEVIKFLETQHKGKYKVYNLCSERLYDASLFEGKVASFPIDEHDCPPMQLIVSFCGSAKSWLQQDVDNVVVVHSKVGIARTGLMISSLLLYLKTFPTADESIEYFNKERCIDSKGLVIPSQIRYVRYFGYTLTYFNGDVQSGRRCMLKGFRLHNCPYWIRPSITISKHSGVLFSTKKHPKTKDLMPEDFWFKSKQKGTVVFALPREPGLTELTGDFKVQFHDRQGDFCCWLNTSMIENRITMGTSELDGFDKRKVPSPGFQVEIVMVDYDSVRARNPASGNDKKNSNGNVINENPKRDRNSTAPNLSKNKDNKDDVFSDSDTEDKESANDNVAQVSRNVEEHYNSGKITNNVANQETSSIEAGKAEAGVANEVKKEATSSLRLEEAATLNSGSASEFKAIAADASVFSFGDEDEYESE
ncbi:hypothetical protein Cni_G02342 [Canna indica]|uniref:Uncharacterized protein n=1 Tax=Canna indica TaxID=4628 RepID=A0AAQ3JPY6_9LILI|nr:hypothetical protein Cni_G02342 [Canna indica]